MWSKQLPGAPSTSGPWAKLLNHESPFLKSHWKENPCSHQREHVAGVRQGVQGASPHSLPEGLCPRGPHIAGGGGFQLGMRTCVDLLSWWFHLEAWQAGLLWSSAPTTVFLFNNPVIIAIISLWIMSVIYRSCSKYCSTRGFGVSLQRRSEAVEWIRAEIKMPPWLPH